eukprot:scaffold5067_cov161-Skeletonema_menzelii.AAC.22
MGPENPQEPGSKLDRPPVCVYDLFFDLPHPIATEKTRIIDPPVTLSPILSEEMYKPDNISRLARFAFPEYDEVAQLQQLASEQEGLLTSRGRTFGANLSKYDIYSIDFVVHHHTFSLLLPDGRTRVHGHVRRYLPQHSDSAGRTDVGRRRPRAMIILTRAIGGERFYTSLLKTVESLMIKARAGDSGSLTQSRDPVRNFLHAVFNNHANIVTQYAEMRRYGLTLNFTQTPKGLVERESKCDIAKLVMEQNEDIFRITVDKLEFGPGGGMKGRNFELEDDRLQFYLPYSLQPGFECIRQDSIPEDNYSPITPLLRFIGPSNFLRVLSALLCERRIILISNSITRLSMCVKAASSALAQGLLMWEHALIPVVPPHLIPSLSANVPYLVGVLTPFVKRLRELEGLNDVLCVDVDKNELKTFNMPNPRNIVPDLLKKVNRKSDQSVPSAETLANDLDEIFQAGNEKVKESGVKASDMSDTQRSDKSIGEASSKSGKKKTIIDRILKKPEQHIMSLAEKRQYATSVDAAAYFGKMIRSNFQKEMPESNNDEETEFSAPKYSKPSQGTDSDSLEACAVAENEGGEEDVRAALTCFFLHMYGDMGMYLSETNGTFWLDRRKFLLRKKQEGEKENSPMFLMLKNLLLHGPLTTISEALDGVPKIYELKSYSNSKNMDQIKEVRRAADQVYQFVVDISLLCVRRRRLAFTKAHEPYTSVIESWGCYAANKVPLTTDSHKMHALFRPGSAAIGGRLYYDTAATAASVAPSVVSNTPSIMALRRLDEHRNSRLDASLTFDDEVNEYQDDFEVHENMNRKQAKKMESSIEEFQNNRSAIDSKRDDTSNIGENNEASVHDITADELFSQDFCHAHGEQKMDEQSSSICASDDAASLLQSFNTAVSSSQTGSYYASSYTGSHYASSHSGSHFSSSEQSSHPRKSRQLNKLKGAFLRGSEIGRLRGFSFPEEKQHTIQEHESEQLQNDALSSNLSVEVSEEGEYT